MPFEPRTAKDLPPGAEVEKFWTTWTKVGPNEWKNKQGDVFTDDDMDNALARGGILTRVPAGRTKEQ